MVLKEVALTGGFEIMGFPSLPHCTMKFVIIKTQLEGPRPYSSTCKLLHSSCTNKAGCQKCAGTL